jgi:uncharacterized protein (UPF0335 family)
MAKPSKTDETPSFTSGDLRPGSNAAGALYSFVERLERLDEERQALVEDMKEVRSEAKGVGFDTKILGMVIRRRKMDTADRQETDAILELYEEAVRQAEKQQTTQSEEDGE